MSTRCGFQSLQVSLFLTVLHSTFHAGYIRHVLVHHRDVLTLLANVERGAPGRRRLAPLLC